MARSMSRPPNRSVSDSTMPAFATTATEVVAPPISTTMVAVISAAGSLAPIDRNRGRCAADIHDHGGGHLRSRKLGADCRRQALLDKVDARCADSLHNVADGEPLNRCDTRGHALDYAAREARAAPSRFADELLQHGLSQFRIRNH